MKIKLHRPYFEKCYNKLQRLGYNTVKKWGMFDKQFLCFEEDTKSLKKKKTTLKCNDYLKESRESPGRKWEGCHSAAVYWLALYHHTYSTTMTVSTF